MIHHNRSSLVLTLIALGLAISPSPTRAQTISFLRQFSTPGISAASAVAADASGVYVFGSGQNSAGARKYDSRGNELWTREFSARGGFRGAAVDATGVYVVGTISPSGPPDAFVRKYDAAGNELWNRRLEAPFVNGVAADATGVYVVGPITNPPGPNVAFLRKYDAGGNELWTRRFPASGFGQASAVAADASGVYVLGEQRLGFPGPGASIFVRKYDASGAELWTRQFGESATDLDYAFATGVAADAAGVYVVGWTRGQFPGQTKSSVSGAVDAFVRKYDAGGNELWTRQFGTSHSASATGVAADGTGVYVVGETVLAGLPGHCRSGVQDAFVRKYDAGGAELWTREFGASFSAAARAVAADATGVYVAGGARDASIGAGNAFLGKFEKAPEVVPQSRPRILPGCVVNAASYIGGGVAPGEIVTIFGSGMGPSQLTPLQVTAERRLATTLADTRILFNGAPAPLLYVSDKQSSAIVPYAVAGRSSVDVQVEYRGVRSDVITVPVLDSRPGIFYLNSSGQGVILNEDGSLNSPSNPAQRGSIVTIYATGGGERDPAVLDGQILSAVVPRVTLPVSVRFDANLEDDEYGVFAEGQVLYAGGVSGSVAGLLQVNVRVPSDARRVGDAVPFALSIGLHATWFQVTMALR